MQSLVSNKVNVLLNKPSCVAQHGGSEDPLDTPGQPHTKQSEPKTGVSLKIMKPWFYSQYQLNSTQSLV